MALWVSPPMKGSDEEALRQLGQRGGKVFLCDEQGSDVLAGWVKMVRKKQDGREESFEVTIVTDWDQKLRRADR